MSMSVCISDGVGKTSLILTLVSEEFPEEVSIETMSYYQSVVHMQHFHACN